MSEPKLRLWTNGCEWVVAADAIDASIVWEEYTGERRIDYDHEWHEDTREAIKVPDDEGGSETRSAAEWVAVSGRGYLWNTEDQ